MIYHYTSINTLALILKHKTMRFSRLDMVDDIEESLYGSSDLKIKLGKYCFVSCWTKSDKENLALWNMYTRYKGVRIGLDNMPFKTYQVTPVISSYFPEIRCYGEDFMIDSYVNHAKLYDVNYVDDYTTKINDYAENLGTGFYINTEDVGLYKRMEWAMQQECRFKIFAFPRNTHTLLKTPNANVDVVKQQFDIVQSFATLIQNKPIQETYFDIQLDEKKLSNIEIMLGPLTTESDRIIVEALLKDYPKAKIYSSSIKIREKN